MGRTKTISDDAAVLRQFVAAVDDATVGRIADKMVEAMASAVTELETDSDVRADTLAASRETAGGFLQGLDADPWIPPTASPALGDLARTMARRGEEITTLIKLTRYGQSEFWPAIMELAEREIEDPSVRMRLLNILFERFGLYLESLLDGAVGTFQDERDALIRGATARREETIKALLEGADLSADAASRSLGYELSRWHTALELWDTGGSQDALDGLEALAREVAEALGGGRPLTTPSSSRGLWAWVATHDPPEDEQRTLISALSVPDGVHVAIGRSAAGIAGFRQSHKDALAGQRVAMASTSENPVTWYAEVEIASLLSSDADGSRALIDRELAGLTGADSQSEKLRATVLAYIRCGGSATAAGRLLGVHTNTVRYRIEQAEGLLGKSLDGEQLPLQLALLLVDSLGASVLPHE